jgi:DNA-binding NtrC family response regulator
MSESARILVIDDDQIIRKTLSATLEQAGYKVDTAENGKEAIEKTEANFYNLALIDIRLPDMEGTELLTSLKETTPRMVKVILTGYPGLRNAMKAINKGVDYYLVKPVEPVELLKVIKEQLDKQKQEKDYGEEKIAKYLETRLKQMRAEELHNAKTTLSGSH